MRILLGLNENYGSNLWASKLMQVAPWHEYRIAAFYKNHTHLHSIDWCLDAVKTKSSNSKKISEIFGHKNIPHVNYKTITQMVNDLVDWDPELVISDVETITAHLAIALSVELWYCSSVLLLTGINKEFKQLADLKSKLKQLPKASRNLIYSPFGDLISAPQLKDGFEWTKPYTGNSSNLKLQKGVRYLVKFCGDRFRVINGETSSLADCFYQGKIPIVVGDVYDDEQRANAELVSAYNLGYNATGAQDNKAIAGRILGGLKAIDLNVKDRLSPELHEMF
jgi:hypothetical protein